MAFMVPVMKNNYDIYKDSRSRKTSECSNGSSNGAAVAAAMGGNGRVRKVSECKSESFATSPSHNYRMQMQRCQSSRAIPRNASRISQQSGSGAFSPTRSNSQGASPPKKTAEAQQDATKFHLRLVEKLRNSFRKDSGKRS